MSNILKDDDMVVRMKKMIEMPEKKETKLWEDLLEMPMGDMCGYALLCTFIHSASDNNFIPDEYVNPIIDKFDLPSVRLFGMQLPQPELEQFIETGDARSVPVSIKIHTINELVNGLETIFPDTMDRIKAVFNERIRIFNEILSYLDPKAEHFKTTSENES